MFGVDSMELLLVGVLALLFIGPKELPGAMRTVGHWVGKVRAMARHFTSGFEEVVREAELEEMEKKWRAENERIMREFPALAVEPELPPDPELPAPAPVDEADAGQPTLPLPTPRDPRELP